MNVVHGDNAQGKTNLIEGLYYAATLRTFRRGARSDYVRWGAESARLALRCETDERPVELEVIEQGSSRKLRVDGAPIERSEEYFGAFNVVLFAPDQLAVVLGEPAGRRAFMDRALFNVDAGHLNVVRRYNHVLRERNALLKQAGRPDDQLLSALDEQLAAAGGELLTRRRFLVQALLPVLREVHVELAGSEALSIRYRARGLELPPPPPAAEAAWIGGARQGEAALIGEHLLTALVARRAQDLRRRFTTVGPHRDELEIELDGHPARLFASQGQCRTVVLALRLAELKWLAHERGESPVLLLDDIGSELDAKRRSVLFTYVSELAVQTFLTTAAPELLPKWENNKYFKVINGNMDEG